MTGQELSGRARNDCIAVESAGSNSPSCPTCLDLIEKFGSAESVAPWFCTCFNPVKEKKEVSTDQQNLEGCFCKPKTWASGRTTAAIYCRCE